MLGCGGETDRGQSPTGTPRPNKNGEKGSSVGIVARIVMDIVAIPATCVKCIEEMPSQIPNRPDRMDQLAFLFQWMSLD